MFSGMLERIRPQREIYRIRDSRAKKPVSSVKSAQLLSHGPDVPAPEFQPLVLPCQPGGQSRTVAVQNISPIQIGGYDSLVPGPQTAVQAIISHLPDPETECLDGAS